MAQSVPPAETQAPLARLALKAEVVLSPEFCGTKKRQSIALKDVFHVGRAACPQILEALGPLFSELNRVDAVPAPGTSAAQVTLIPRFVDVAASQQPMLPSSKRQLTITLEWRAQDPAGRVVWLQAVAGSSDYKAGIMITSKKVNALVDAATSELVQNSLAKISASPELRRLSR